MRKVALPPEYFERFKQLQKDPVKFPQAMNMGLSSTIKLLDRLKQGRAYVYQAPVDLSERLADL